ncbi:MAG: M28 family peptidase [Cytophagales bacterium]|nr:M28 family peptidase [Cytophaga sp.]
MRIKNFSIVALLGTVVLFYDCKDNKQPVEQHEGTKPEVVLEKVPVPEFNADSAYSYVASQVAFGPRVPNTKAHIDCAAYLSEFLTKNSGWVFRQDFVAKAFDGKELKLKNIIASYNLKASKRILLAAHWDTRPFADQDPSMIDQQKPIDGANDGASGVAILMEIARAIQLAEKKPDVGIDFILFDGEDYGQPAFYQGPYQDNSWCLGSQYWSKNKHSFNYTAEYGILLDMVGAKNATFAREGVSMQNAPEVVQNVWATGQRLGYGNHFINYQSDGITDDHAYVNSIAKIKMIDIIEFDESDGNYFGAYWHTHNDNLKVIDKATLKAVGQTLLEVVYREKL